LTTLDLEGWTCPLPLRDRENVVMGHGGGGRLTAELVEHLFLPAFGAAGPDGAGDSAVLELGGARLAFSTDSYVVQPLFFPGGNIGDLAINGTVNDLAMSGAVPMYLSCGFILEEGLALRTLQLVAASMGAAAAAAGVRLVTGDTKVVDTGSGDGMFVNTAGIGLIPDGVRLGPSQVQPGDAVLVSGPIGQHGIAIMSVRNGLEFGTVVASDTAALGGLVAAMLAAAPGAVHALRDPTRGGVAASLNELATEAGVGVQLVERDIPVPEAVAAGCSLMGLDPLYVANEGRLVAMVDPAAADQLLEVMRSRPEGSGACRIGTVVAEHPGVLVVRTGIGGTRIVDLPLGEQLPRIC
jgi:hydrogenase expression/formation protein HypE